MVFDIDLDIDLDVDLDIDLDSLDARVMCNIGSGATVMFNITSVLMP